MSINSGLAALWGSPDEVSAVALLEESGRVRRRGGEGTGSPSLPEPPAPDDHPSLAHSRPGALEVQPLGQRGEGYPSPSQSLFAYLLAAVWCDSRQLERTGICSCFTPLRALLCGL